MGMTQQVIGGDLIDVGLPDTILCATLFCRKHVPLPEASGTKENPVQNKAPERVPTSSQAVKQSLKVLVLSAV